MGPYSEMEYSWYIRFKDFEPILRAHGFDLRTIGVLESRIGGSAFWMLPRLSPSPNWGSLQGLWIPVGLFLCSFGLGAISA